MHQHTGNWSGKTVANSEGIWKLNERKKEALIRYPGFIQQGYMEVQLIDSPGCYSLEVSSAEEVVAKEQICDPSCQGIVVVCDGTCLERNLILALQILSYRKDVILCINLMDEVRKKGIKIDTALLEKILGVPVIETESKKKRETRLKLCEAVTKLIESKRQENNVVGYNIGLLESPETLAQKAEDISNRVVEYNDEGFITNKLDKWLTNPAFGYPIMILMLLVILWITIKGANYPSEVLGDLLFSLETPLYDAIIKAGIPIAASQMLVFGLYRVLVWVVSVMLPPMAIFFPLFTLLEDWGLLPRIAFNLDRCFSCCKACGKQALTMCMGLGCNASAVVGCRIIDSQRERLLAMVTNSIMPCNGRFPILIGIIAMFFAAESGFKSAVMLTFMIILAIVMTLFSTKILSKTLLSGENSSFVLELPPYRKPEIGKVIIRSIFDRTLFVLGRAVVVAAPAGALIWILANVYIGDSSIVDLCARFLDPIGQFIGLDGVILVAFILGIPANEIVLPVAMMIYQSQGTLAEVSNLMFFKDLLIENGWTTLTAINMMIFSIMHWPCATTLLSIKKESGSWKWVIISVIVPLSMGCLLCFFTTMLYRFFL